MKQKSNVGVINQRSKHSGVQLEIAYIVITQWYSASQIEPE